MKTKTIKTKIGIINARDAMVVKELSVCVYPNSIRVLLDVSTKYGSENMYKEKFVDATVIFNGVISHSLVSLDYYPYDNYLESCFCEVIDSKYLSKNKLAEKGYKHLILSCYDHVLEVVCNDYMFVFPEN